MFVCFLFFSLAVTMSFLMTINFTNSISSSSLQETSAALSVLQPVQYRSNGGGGQQDGEVSWPSRQPICSHTHVSGKYIIITYCIPYYIVQSLTNIRTQTRDF